MPIYTAGRHAAKVTDYGISETKAGDPQVFVTFDVTFPTGEARMTWYGSFKAGKAQEITFKALQELGLTGKVTDLSLGPDGGALLLGTEASVVVEEENRQDGQGTWFRIRWVNRPGNQAGAVQRSDAGAAKAKLAALGVDGAMAKFKATNPAPAGDIPF